MSIRIGTKKISAGAERRISVNMQPWLEGLVGTALLTGTPTATEVGTSHLTITSVQINAGTIEINGEDVAAGKAIQFLVSVPTGKEGNQYEIRISAATDSSPSEREPMHILLDCV